MEHEETEYRSMCSMAIAVAGGAFATASGDFAIGCGILFASFAIYIYILRIQPYNKS